jgi:hypothetical protein
MQHNAKIMQYVLADGLSKQVVFPFHNVWSFSQEARHFEILVTVFCSRCNIAKMSEPTQA